MGSDALQHSADPRASAPAWRERLLSQQPDEHSSQTRFSSIAADPCVPRKGDIVEPHRVIRTAHIEPAKTEALKLE
jgi:hypothetical protein